MQDGNEGCISKICNKQSIVSALPAFLLCKATLLILALDIFLPAMKDAQYLVYPIVIRIVGLISLVLAAMFMMADINNDSLHIDAADVCFLIFMLFIVISSFINGWDSQTLFGVKYRYIGVLDLFIYIATYMYCSGRIRSDKLRDAVLMSFMTAANIIAMVCIADRIAVTISAFEDKRSFAGMFYHGNHYGYFLSIAVTIAAGYIMIGKGKKVLIGGLSLALNMIVMLINHTRGSMLGAGIAVIIMAIWLQMRGKARTGKSLCVIFGFAIGVIAAFILSGRFRADMAEMTSEIILILSGTNDIYAGNGRWGIWQFVIERIGEKPFWGYGNEGIADILYDYALTASPHNEPLTYAAFFGIPAAISYVGGVVIRIFKMLRDGRGDNTGIIAAFAAMAYFISSLFGVAMFYTAPFMFVMLGLSHRENHYGQDAL